MASLHSQIFFQTRLKKDRIRTAPILIFTTLLAGFAPTQSAAQNLPTWMADQGAYIATVPTKGIAMPGTHDPATYQVPADGDYFKNQTVDLTGQLNNGSRWFDLRVEYLTTGCAPFFFGTCIPIPEKPDGAEVFPLPGAIWSGKADFYLYGHNYNYSNITLANGLDQVRAFLDAHPKEIVILQLSGTISPNQNGDQLSTPSFMQILDQHLRRTSDNASYVYDLKTACTLSDNDYYPLSTYEGYCDGPPLAPQEIVPQQLYGTSARVILLNNVAVATSYAAPSTFNLVWSQDNAEVLAGYYGSGAGSTNLELSRLENGDGTPGSGLYGRRTNWQDYDKDSKILTLQAELTPFGDVQLSDPDPFTALLGPIYAANYFNPILASTIQSFWQPNSVNVVSVDNVTCCNIAQSIIAHNVLTFNRVPLNPNGASAFAIGKNGSVYKLGFSDPINHGNIEPDHSLYKLVGSGSTEGWAPVNVLAQGRGGATEYGIRLAVDPTGSVWIVQASGQILKQDASGNFQPVSGPAASDIAVGDDGSVFIIGPGGMPYQYNGTTWNILPGITNATRIAAGPTGTTTVVASGAIYQYANNHWNNLNAPFTANSVGVDEDRHVWAIGPDSSDVSSVWRLTSVWGRYRENGVTLAVGHISLQVDSIYVADQYGNAHRLGFPVVGATPRPINPDIAGESAPSNQ